MARYTNNSALSAALRQTQAPESPASFGSFGATELFCPKCQCSMPVREKMLLVIPGGELFDYCCKQCGTTVGKKQTGPR